MVGRHLRPSAPQADVVLDLDTVSGVHAELKDDGDTGELFVIDLDR